MDIEQQLMNEMSRRNIDLVANYIGNDESRFHTLIEMVFVSAHPLPMRAAWAISIITDKHPELLFPYLDQIISNIERFDHPGTRRNMLRYFSEMKEIPEEHQGRLYDICWRWLLSIKEPIAIRANSMKVLYLIAKEIPELLAELKLVLDELNEGEMPAIKSVARNILKQLKSK